MDAAGASFLYCRHCNVAVIKAWIRLRYKKDVLLLTMVHCDTDIKLYTGNRQS